jgi:hypothetical protein
VLIVVSTHVHVCSDYQFHNIVAAGSDLVASAAACVRSSLPLPLPPLALDIRCENSRVVWARSVSQTCVRAWSGFGLSNLHLNIRVCVYKEVDAVDAWMSLHCIPENLNSQQVLCEAFSIVIAQIVGAMHVHVHVYYGVLGLLCCASRPVRKKARANCAWLVLELELHLWLSLLKLVAGT